MVSEKLIALDTRPGVTQRCALIRPRPSSAVIVLFAGGPGVIGLAECNGHVSYRRDINFLVRSRWLFAEERLVVAVMDAPSDHQGARGMLGGFRNSAEHVADIDAVIAWLAKKSGLPVWLVGTSRGSESAAFAGLHGNEPIAGLILTSNITVTTDDGLSLLELPLQNIIVPVLIAAHKGDECPLTPPAAAQPLAARFVNAPRLEVAMFDGGDSPLSEPCEPLCQHGFLGTERNVVARIASFIRD